MNRRAGALEVTVLSVRLENRGGIVGHEPYRRVHDRIDLIAVFPVCRRSQAVAMDDLAAGGIGNIEAIAFDAPELGVVGMVFHLVAGHDLNLLDRRAERILLLLEPVDILIDALLFGTSAEDRKRNEDDSKPLHQVSPLPKPPQMKGPRNPAALASA